MTPQQRIRLARRHGALSQAELAKTVGVQRSAVSHWESTHGKNPSVRNLRAVAIATGVNFEWLATGRGAMTLSEQDRLDSIPAVDALLADDPLEMRLLQAFRESSPQSRVSLVEVVEQLAAQRIGRGRPGFASSARASQRVRPVLALDELPELEALLG